MEHLTQMGLAAGLAWASGLRLYATIFIVGLLGRTGHLILPHDLLVLESNWLLATAAALLLGEFLADKIPVFDSVWDAVHTFIRIPAGAALAWGAMGDTGAGTQVAAALLGGAITSGTHLAKSGARAAVNTSPEPFSNWTLSFGEDGLLVAGLYLAIAHPMVFLFLLAIFLGLIIWLLPKLLRLVARVGRRFLQGRRKDARIPEHARIGPPPDGPRMQAPRKEA